MSAPQQEIMTAKLFFNAAFPVMQVLLDDVPKLHEKFQRIKAVVQFGAKNDGELLCCHLIFKDGIVNVVQGPAPKYDLALTFSGIEKMNALLRGGLAIPSIRGKLSLLPNILSLLMGLMIMSPKKIPKDFAGQALKVKCSLYMITRALSQYNKLGDPDMQEFCRRQPDRIYQFTVANGDDPQYIACYLRVQAGKSKSGHGVYTRRTPFVHFSFKTVEGAMKVLLKEVAFVKAVEEGYVETIGSPEYACYLNDYMAILQGMMT
jgi:hypothetical protein